MKTSSFVIFISIALGIYTLGNVYIFYHGYQAVGNIKWLRIIYIFAFLICYLAYIAARFLQSRGDTLLTHCLLTVGSFWMAAIIYFLLICLGIDIIRLANHFLKFDWIIFSAVLLLSLFGLIEIYSIALGQETLSLLNFKKQINLDFILKTRITDTQAIQLTTL